MGKKKPDALETPIFIFQKYFTDELFESMVNYTNSYIALNNAKCASTDMLETKTFVGIHIIMGNLYYSRVWFYWQQKLAVSIISDNMTFNRFSKLWQNVHFMDTTKPNSNDGF